MGDPNNDLPLPPRQHTLTMDLTGADFGRALLAAYKTLPVGGTILLPPGTVTITSPLVLGTKPLRLAGSVSSDSTGGTRIIVRTKRRVGFVFSGIRGLVLEDLQITGEEMAKGSFLIEMRNGVYNAVINRCVIQNGANGIWAHRVSRLKIHNSSIKTFTDKYCVLLNGVGDEDGTQAVEFVNSTIAANAPHVDNVVQDGLGGSVKFVASYVGSGRHGYWQRNTTGGSDPNFLYVTAGGFENGVGDCLRLEAGQKALIGGGAYFSSSGPGDGIALRGNFNGAVITGAYIRGNGRHGILHDSGTLTLGASDVVNNGFWGRPAHGIHIAAVSDNGNNCVRLTLSEAPAVLPWEDGDRVMLCAGRRRGPVSSIAVIDARTVDLLDVRFDVALTIAARTGSRRISLDRLGDVVAFHTATEGLPSGTSIISTNGLGAMLSQAAPATVKSLAVKFVFSPPPSAVAVRLGQGLRSTARAGTALVAGVHLGATAGGRNHQEYGIYGENDRLRTDGCSSEGNVAGSFRDTAGWATVGGCALTCRINGKLDAGVKHDLSDLWIIGGKSWLVHCIASLEAGEARVTVVVDDAAIGTTLMLTVAGVVDIRFDPPVMIDARQRPRRIQLLVAAAKDARGLALQLVHRRG